MQISITYIHITIYVCDDELILHLCYLRPNTI